MFECWSGRFLVAKRPGSRLWTSRQSDWLADIHFLIKYCRIKKRTTSQLSRNLKRVFWYQTRLVYLVSWGFINNKFWTVGSVSLSLFCHLTSHHRTPHNARSQLAQEVGLTDKKSGRVIGSQRLAINMAWYRPKKSTRVIAALKIDSYYNWNDHHWFPSWWNVCEVQFLLRLGSCFNFPVCLNFYIIYRQLRLWNVCLITAIEDLVSQLTLRKIAIWLSKNWQKLDI